MLNLLVLYVFLLFLLVFLISRLTCGIAKSQTCLIGKTAIVTGGNEGIGYQICLMLASRGCRVIIADIANSEETKRKIIEQTTNPNIITKTVDLASFKSIRAFAENINKTEEAVHILINNAGVAASKPWVSDDGVNRTYQINHYGPFLLTHLLIDLLKKSGPSRVIFTTSLAAFSNNLNENRINPTDPELETNNTVSNCIYYGNTKACVIMSTNEMAKRLKGTGVTVNCLHPGMVRTKTIRKAVALHDFKWDGISFLYVWNFLMYICGKSAWEGAQNAVHLACSKDLENVTGKFFLDCTVFPVKPYQTYSKKLSDLLWKTSEELVGLKENEKLKP